MELLEVTGLVVLNSVQRDAKSALNNMEKPSGTGLVTWKKSSDAINYRLKTPFALK